MSSPCALAFAGALQATGAAAADWPQGLPVYDHIVVVMEENKGFEQIVGANDAPYINRLAREGALFTRMFGEEHNSEGNYFWLLSGSNQGVGFGDEIPKTKFSASNLAQQLIDKKLSFKGYAEDLPAIGSEAEELPENCNFRNCVYARKHVPWISFANIPNGTTVETSSNLRFADFPRDFSQLPTVAFVVPDEFNAMHSGPVKRQIKAGDTWLRRHLEDYFRWARNNNSLLIVTFDENNNNSKPPYSGLTDPRSNDRVTKNRIATIAAGARIKSGKYAEDSGITHVNLLRSLEAMYGLPKSGMQQENAAKAGIDDDFIVTDIFRN
jgi:phospholipase C